MSRSVLFRMLCLSLLFVQMKPIFADEPCGFNCVPSNFSAWAATAPTAVGLPADVNGLGVCQEVTITATGGGDQDCVTTAGTCSGGKIAIRTKTNGDGECNSLSPYSWSYTPAEFVRYENDTLGYHATIVLKTPLDWNGTDITVTASRDELAAVMEGNPASDSMLLKKGTCGSGTYGLNINRATLDSSHFPSNTIRAIAWVESTWKQFNCDGTVRDVSGSSAKGLMMIIDGHLTENYGTCAPIASGSICTADGIVGNELCNLASGIGIYGHCVSVSTNQLPSGATAAQIELDALAKYKAGFGGGEYWDRSQFPNFSKHTTNLDSKGINYADDVTSKKASTPWTSHLDCPC